MHRIINPENAEHYTWGAGCDGWHLLKSSSLSIIQERMPPAATEINHYHQFSRQFFYILCGEATLKIDGQSMVLRPGQGIEVPPRTPHQLLNRSDQEVHFIVVSAPPSHGDRVEVG